MRLTVLSNAVRGVILSTNGYNNIKPSSSPPAGRPSRLVEWLTNALVIPLGLVERVGLTQNEDCTTSLSP